MKKFQALMISVLAVSGFLVVYFMELESGEKVKALLILFGIACISIILLSVEGIFRLWSELSLRVRQRISIAIFGLLGALGCAQIYQVFVMRSTLSRAVEKYDAMLDVLINEQKVTDKTARPID